jgi:hypothetical protein
MNRKKIDKILWKNCAWVYLTWIALAAMVNIAVDSFGLYDDYYCTEIIRLNEPMFHPIEQCISDDECGKCTNDELQFIVVERYCDYKLKSKLVAFLLSFFVGGFGVDYFYLSMGKFHYIGCGIGKMFTCGGCGIWWMVSWIQILCDALPDGNGYPLHVDP